MRWPRIGRAAGSELRRQHLWYRTGNEPGQAEVRNTSQHHLRFSGVGEVSEVSSYGFESDRSFEPTSGPIESDGVRDIILIQVRTHKAGTGAPKVGRYAILIVLDVGAFCRKCLHEELGSVGKLSTELHGQEAARCRAGLGSRRC